VFPNFQRIQRSPLAAVVLIAIIAAVTSGCAPKPPGCDDPQIADRLRQSVPRDGVKVIQVNFDAAGAWQKPGADKLRAQLDAFIKTIKVDLGTITTEGYDSAAKKHSCTADLTVTMDGAPVQIKRLAYSIQGTSDGKDFVLNVPQYELILGEVLGSFNELTVKAERAAAAAAPAPVQSSSASGCVDAKMAQFRQKLNLDLSEDAKRADANGELFKGLSPPAMEEWEEKHMAQARRECP
jgi:hypothetical protein